MPDSDKRIDLTEIEPGIWGIRRRDPHAEQWKGFWAAIRVLIAFVAVGVAIDLIF